MKITKFLLRTIILLMLSITLITPLVIIARPHGGHGGKGHCGCGRGRSSVRVGRYTASKLTHTTTHYPHYLFIRNRPTHKNVPLVNTMVTSFIVSMLICGLYNFVRAIFRVYNTKQHSYPFEAHTHSMAELVGCALLIGIALMLITDNLSIVIGFIAFWTAIQIWHDKTLKVN